MATADLLIPRWYVEIDGVRRTLLGGTTVSSASRFVATADLDLLLAEGKPRPGQVVRVFAGYGAATQVIFTGEIDTNGVIARPNDLTIQCSGFLARLRDPIGVAPDITEGLDGPESDPEPVVTYESMTAGAIIADVLDRYGVPAYSVDDGGDLFGELEPIPVFGDDPGDALVQDLDEADLSGEAPYRGFWRTCDAPDGTVRRLPWSRVASGTAARVFTDDDHLFAGQIEQSRTGIRNRVIVTGLAQKGTTGVEFVPTGLAETATPLVPTPPGFRAATYQLPLLEDGDRCQSWAEAKLGELNRLTQTLPCDLVAGDASLRVGMTVAVVSPTLGLSGGERLLIEEVQHTLGEAEGFQTSLGLYLTAEGAGYSPNLPPVAVIAAKGMRETLADGTDQYEISLDGSASYDPELGIPGIVSYAWSGSPQTPTPIGVGRTASVRYADGIPDGATVTLTVTDTLGATGSLTLPITLASVPFVVRDIIAAVKTKLETSRDGQRTWREVKVGGADIAAVGTCEIGAADYTFAWDGSGKLFKVLANDTATDVSPAGSVTACTIHTDQAGTADGRVWVGCADGRIFLSPDHGVTWQEMAPAPNGGAVTYIQESFYAAGQMEMTAGRTYYTSFSSAGDWVEGYAHPNTGLIAARFASGFGQGWLGYSGPNNGLDAGAPRLRERTNAVSVGPPGGETLSIVGLTMDIYEAILYVADNDPISGVGRLWSAPTEFSGNLTSHAYDDATYDDLRHMIRDGGMPGLLYLAARRALLKSPDGLATVQTMRNLSGGREGMMIGYGAERALGASFAVTSLVANTRVLGLWNGSSNNAPPAGWQTIGYDDGGWGVPVLREAAPYSGMAGAEALWRADVSTGTEADLFRTTFVLTALQIRTATLSWDGDDIMWGIYLNGTLLDSWDPPAHNPVGGDDHPVRTIAIDPALLVPGGINVIAAHAEEGFSGSASEVGWRLEVNA